jgi:bifunctional DNase/RNase
MAVEMVVDSVHAHPLLPQRLLILRPAAAERPGVCLLLVIGPAEADAIALRLLGEAPPRPRTHDLLCDLLRLLGGRVTHVLVHTAVAGTF